MTKTMRSSLATALALAMVLPIGFGAQAGEVPAASFRQSLSQEAAEAAPAPPTMAFEDRLLVAGLGAIGGIVAFNLAMGGTAALPFMAESAMAQATATGIPLAYTEGPVAVSRVYAVSTAVAGALVADYAYRKATEGSLPRIPKAVANRVAPY